MNAPARHRRLLELARWVALALIVKVTASIVSNYPSYFPPDFGSLFLEGREGQFWGTYSFFFYVHILTAPFVLLSGTVLLCERLLRRHRAFHTWLGRVHVFAVLGLLVPSSLVMATQAFGGWPAGSSFALLSVVTGVCAVMGVYHARRRQFAEHRRWMVRLYLLLCSAVVLRLISGTASVIGVDDAEAAYRLAAWASWIGPLAVYEVVEGRMTKCRRGTA
ncbi:DUF2306 domain-containing protein [Limnoglobus roseus]|uniref:DUF2306 domain-containing protein n=1 Tax=Limnoglobus roseus TaxID=2598579 RepID=A0A5C1AAZ8_9BACT|nr:DUF2306 domain-containing protein [Limnoglobus roseus]QEL14304.1 hypothetical protein PX52LOC_01176 [Limnoglobus roseus]